MGEVRPLSVTVFGQQIQIIYTNDLPDAHGEYDPNSQIIKIDDNLSSSLARLVIFHELLHVVEDLCDLRLSESYICILSTAIIQMIVDNNDLSNWAFGVPIKEK